MTEPVKKQNLNSSAPVRPLAEDMIKDIHAYLTRQVKALDEACQKSLSQKKDTSGPGTLFEIAYPAVRKKLEKFEALVKNLPEGFCLEPVLYTKVPYDQGQRVYEEFERLVQPRFYQFLATQHAKDLRALGISENGIKRMQNGYWPVNEDGISYMVSIDHIEERSGCGEKSKQKAIDPLMPSKSPATFLVNHFENLILIPEAVHEAKNFLNNLQDATQTGIGQSRWILMLVPKKEAEHRFVAKPAQTGQNNLALRKIKGVTEKLKAAADSISFAVEAVSAFCRDPIVAGFLKDSRLSKDFNAFSAAMRRNPAHDAALEECVKPAVQRVVWGLSSLFEVASQRKGSVAEQELVKQAVAPDRLQKIIQKFPFLPIVEVVSLRRKVYKQIGG